MLSPAIAVYKHRATVRAMAVMALSGARVSARTVTASSTFFADSAVSGSVPDADPAVLAAFARVTQADSTQLVRGGLLPPTFYVTWALGAMARSLAALRLPYAYAQALHASSAVNIVRPLRFGEAARYTGNITQIDDSERRARLHWSGRVRAEDGSDRFDIGITLHLPKRQRRAEGARSRPGRPEVPADSEPLEALALPIGLGGRYALASGDFNPVHWARPVARTMGFGDAFIQGYCTKALATHAAIARLMAGDQTRLRSVAVEFRAPIILPANIGVFVGPAATGTPADGLITRALFVGAAVGAPAAMMGTICYAAT